MRGTHKWQPGAPLGAGRSCRPDKLLGDVPNANVYATNKPAESALIKRSASATISSHRVSPPGRAGLIRELAALKPQLSALRTALAAAERRGRAGGRRDTSPAAASANASAADEPAAASTPVAAVAGAPVSSPYILAVTTVLAAVVAAAITVGHVAGRRGIRAVAVPPGGRRCTPLLG